MFTRLALVSVLSALVLACLGCGSSSFALYDGEYSARNVNSNDSTEILTLSARVVQNELVEFSGRILTNDENEDIILAVDYWGQNGDGLTISESDGWFVYDDTNGTGNRFEGNFLSDGTVTCSFWNINSTEGATITATKD